MKDTKAKSMDTFLPDTATQLKWTSNARILGTTDSAFWGTLPPLPQRPISGHKGTFGTVLVIGGSRGMSGSISLTGIASLVAGAGLTRIMTPEAIVETVAGFEREYTVIPCACDAQGRLTSKAYDSIVASAEKATVVAIGPGLGRSQELDALVTSLFFDLEKPAVFDADALNALSSSRALEIAKAEGRLVRAPRVMTPHPGEIARLLGKTEKNEPYEAARLLTERLTSVCERFALVLKYWRTLVSQQNGTCYVENRTGNPNLATGGSGDVLTGIVAGLLAQGLSVDAAARSAVALHGLSADLRATICSRGAIASDIVRFLPAAFDFYALARQTALETNAN